MIFYFTGTGNSRYAALLLAEQLGEKRVVDMAHALMHKEMNYDLDESEPVGWVFPVHSWGVPPLVLAFIRHVKLTLFPDNYHYMMCTCGDDTGLAHKMWRRAILEHDREPDATFSVQMPNTYTLLPGFDVDPKDVEQQKLAAVPMRIATVARRVKQRWQGDDVETGSWAWAKTRIVFPLFRRWGMSAKPFHTTDDCTTCGRCSRECPMENITIGADSYPVWGNRCAMCLRCYHVCPHHAVAYGNATEHKGQYLCPRK